MDRDFAPLEDLVAIAARPDAFLIVDEAHTGVYGEQGRELTAPCEGRENLPVVHTCGKALGAAGALVTASGVLRNLMVNRCRPFIFAAAPSSLPSPCGQRCRSCRRSPSASSIWPSSSRLRIGRCVNVAGKVLRARRLCPVSLATCARNAAASALQARGFDIRRSGRQRCQLARSSLNFTDAQRRRGGCACNA